jgi:hypothetical protein
MKESLLDIGLFFTREDAESIAKSKKDVYITSKALEYLPKCIQKIKTEAENMKFETSIWIEKQEFTSEIGVQLEKILNSIGYGTNMIPGPRNGWHVNIFWRELTDEELNPI